MLGLSLLIQFIMSTVTKAIAQEVAVKLVSKKRDAIKVMQDKFESEFTEGYLKSIPKAVMDVFKTNPEWIETTGYLQLSGNGWNWLSINLNKKLPKKQSSGRSFSPNDELAVSLKNQYDKIKDAEAKMNKTIKEIEVTLFNLRTYKRVEENFPEAFEFLPAKITTALSTDISALRSEIKRVP